MLLPLIHLPLPMWMMSWAPTLTNWRLWFPAQFREHLEKTEGQNVPSRREPGQCRISASSFSQSLRRYRQAFPSSRRLGCISSLLHWEQTALPSLPSRTRRCCKSGTSYRLRDQSPVQIKMLNGIVQQCRRKRLPGFLACIGKLYSCCIRRYYPYRIIYQCCKLKNNEN